MNTPLKQHLIDPEICIRCYTCENTCPIGAIEHDDNNVVVDATICNSCMDCIPVCPTGSIDEWRVVEKPYSLEEQYEWMELPEQGEIAQVDVAETTDDTDADPVAALLAEAHKGAGGKAKRPATASKPTINLYNLGNPVDHHGTSTNGWREVRRHGHVLRCAHSGQSSLFWTFEKNTVQLA